MDGIKKWFTACGANFGVDQVHPYRWPDADTRPEVPYITFTPVSLRRLGGPLRNDSEVSGYDVTTHTAEEVDVTLRIDLYRSEYGLPHLSWCAMAAEKEQAIKDIFDSYRMAFKGTNGEITEKTTFDDAEIDYHQSMVVVVRLWLDYAHFNRNHKVETVVINSAVSLE